MAKSKAKYRRNFISDAIFRLDFTQPISNAVHASLKKALKIGDDDYFAEPISRNIITIEANKKTKFDSKVIGRQSVYKVPGGRLELTNDAFILVMNKYEEFASYLAFFKSSVETLENIIKSEIDYKRVGLRYINRIDLPTIKEPDQWAKYIHSDFFGHYQPMTSNDSRFSLRRNLNHHIYGGGEYMTQIRTGVWNSDFPIQISSQSYIVDIDCYIDSLVLTSEEVWTKVDEMNDIAYNFFKQIITTELEKVLQKA